VGEPFRSRKFSAIFVTASDEQLRIVVSPIAKHQMVQ
jgi:hypothetical protein